MIVSVPALPVGKKVIAIFPLWSMIGLIVRSKRVDTILSEAVVSISRFMIQGCTIFFSLFIEIGQASGLFLSSLRLICIFGKAVQTISAFHHCRLYRDALLGGKLYVSVKFQLFRVQVDHTIHSILNFHSTNSKSVLANINHVLLVI